MASDNATLDFDAVDTADIAAMLRCTREHVTDRLTKRPGFPKPRVELSQKHRLWDRDDVLAFVKTKPRRKPRASQ